MTSEVIIYLVAGVTTAWLAAGLEDDAGGLGTWRTAVLQVALWPLTIPWFYLMTAVVGAKRRKLVRHYDRYAATRFEQGEE